MKLKATFLLCALLAAASSFAQTVYISGGAWGSGGGGGGGGGGGDLLDGTLCPDSNGFLVRTSSGTCAIRGFESPAGTTIISNPLGTAGPVGIDTDPTVTCSYSEGAGAPPATCTPCEIYRNTSIFETYLCTDNDFWEITITQATPTNDAVPVGDGTGYANKVLPNGAVSYATSTNTFSAATFANVAASTSAELRGVLSDEYGGGIALFLDGSGNLDLGGTRTVFGSLAVISAQTGTASTTAAQSGYIITNTGDADGSTNNLLDNPTAGVTYSFAVTVAQTITVAPASGETLYMNAAACANVTSATIGGALSVVAVTGGSGGVWVASGAGWTCN